MTRLTTEEKQYLCIAIAELYTAAPQSKQIELLAQGLKQTELVERIALNSSNATRYCKMALQGKQELEPTTSSPSERIKQAEDILTDAIKDLDIERHHLMEKIQQIDNMVAKYKMFQRSK